MTYDLRQQPGGHPKGDEVESDSAFLCAMCGLPYSLPEKASAATPQTHQTTARVGAKSKARK